MKTFSTSDEYSFVLLTYYYCKDRTFVYKPGEIMEEKVLFTIMHKYSLITTIRFKTKEGTNTILTGTTYGGTGIKIKLHLI